MSITLIYTRISYLTQLAPCAIDFDEDTTAAKYAKYAIAVSMLKIAFRIFCVIHG